MTASIALGYTMFDENPVDFRDRHEVEGYLLFALGCVLFAGIAINLMFVALVAYAN